MPKKKHPNDSESTFIRHVPCPHCGSSDANSLYSDGHHYCHSCSTYTPADKADGTPATPTRAFENYVSGEPIALSKRGLTDVTCEKWGYTVGSFRGQPCQIANYRDDNGQVVAQKIRLPDKSFTWTGDPKKARLYGQHLWRTGGKMIVVTEGEVDALTVSQLQGNKWPVVSIPNGAQGAKKDLAKQIQYLETFETIVLFFDNDDPGHKAAEECCALFTPGKVKVARVPLKDANEMLQQGRGNEVLDAIWGAKAWRPEGVIGVEDVIEQARKPVEWGVSWPWQTLTDLTYGIRTRECYAVGAGVGAGKTDFFTQIIAHFIKVHKETVGLLYLEQNPVETAKRVAGKIAEKPFHVPDAGWTQKELDTALDALKGKVHFYNHFGSTDWEVIKNLIRYMVVGLGVRRIFLDHLTALVSHAEDERRALDALMAELAGLAQELDITIFFISHLTTPEGKSHEEGGRVEARHFRGSRAIMQWANFMIGLERNQQAEDPTERQVTTVRILKDRNTGRATGATTRLIYNKDTGMSTELDEEAAEALCKSTQATPQPDF